MEPVGGEGSPLGTAGIKPHRHRTDGRNQLQRGQRAQGTDDGAAGHASAFEKARGGGVTRCRIEGRECRETTGAAPESIQRRPCLGEWRFHWPASGPETRLTGVGAYRTGGAKRSPQPPPASGGVGGGAGGGDTDWMIAFTLSMATASGAMPTTLLL